MDRNTVIGISLIFILFYIWARVNAPTEEQLAQMEQQRDSLALVESQELSPTLSTPADASHAPDVADLVLPDSAIDQRRIEDFGPFAAAAAGIEELIVLENDLLKLSISTKGGTIRTAEVKEHKKLSEDEEFNEIYSPLLLLEDERNQFEYLFPTPGVTGGMVKSSDLYYKASRSGDELTLTADLGSGRKVEQIYRMQPEAYDVEYSLRLTGMERLLTASEGLTLNWKNHLDRIEINTNYEKMMSSVYFKGSDEDPDYCSCTGDDTEDVDGQPVKWVSHSNQFFHSSLIAKNQPFTSAVLETRSVPEESEDLKILLSQIKLPLAGRSNEQFDMTWYIGPKDFDILRTYDIALEETVAFGQSIFGSINRWIIRPIFNFLSKYIGSKGIVILLLTLIVKSLVYPLTYKMIRSQSKMAALKPQMAKTREKYKDDQQKMQMENMKLYREYGVNPAGGCFPMALQMPIWFALYRFFPASIEFRQASFLWANDLSSYDVFFRLPWDVPFLGAHISLFTILYAVTLIMYTYYNSKLMDMNSINPMMKYMQYAMPLMFVVFFNSYASGLTCYLLFSNIFNIAQTLITKNYLIDHKKIEEELSANKKKPKKKGGFQERLQNALAEQQRVAAEREKTGKRKK